MTRAVLFFVCLLAVLSTQMVLAVLDRDPDVSRSIQEVIEARGYKCEKHHAVTRDGYILEMYRIPQGRLNATSSEGKRRHPALLQHGLLDSCVSWFVNADPEESLAFKLADAG